MYSMLHTRIYTYIYIQYVHMQIDKSIIQKSYIYNVVCYYLIIIMPVYHMSLYSAVSNDPTPYYVLSTYIAL